MAESRVNSNEVVESSTEAEVAQASPNAQLLEELAGLGERVENIDGLEPKSGENIDETRSTGIEGLDGVPSSKGKLIWEMLKQVLSTGVERGSKIVDRAKELAKPHLENAKQAIILKAKQEWAIVQLNNNPQKGDIAKSLKKQDKYIELNVELEAISKQGREKQREINKVGGIMGLDFLHVPILGKKARLERQLKGIEKKYNKKDLQVNQAKANFDKDLGDLTQTCDVYLQQIQACRQLEVPYSQIIDRPMVRELTALASRVPELKHYLLAAKEGISAQEALRRQNGQPEPTQPDSAEPRSKANEQNQATSQPSNSSESTTESNTRKEEPQNNQEQQKFSAIDILTKWLADPAHNGDVFKIDLASGGSIYLTVSEKGGQRGFTGQDGTFITLKQVTDAINSGNIIPEVELLTPEQVAALNESKVSSKPDQKSETVENPALEKKVEEISQKYDLTEILGVDPEEYKRLLRNQIQSNLDIEGKEVIGKVVSIFRENLNGDQSKINDLTRDVGILLTKGLTPGSAERKINGALTENLRINNLNEASVKLLGEKIVEQLSKKSQPQVENKSQPEPEAKPNAEQPLRFKNTEDGVNTAVAKLKSLDIGQSVEVMAYDGKNTQVNVILRKKKDGSFATLVTDGVQKIVNKDYSIAELTKLMNDGRIFASVADIADVKKPETTNPENKNEKPIPDFSKVADGTMYSAKDEFERRFVFRVTDESLNKDGRNMKLKLISVDGAPQVNDPQRFIIKNNPDLPAQLAGFKDWTYQEPARYTPEPPKPAEPPSAEQQKLNEVMGKVMGVSATLDGLKLGIKNDTFITVSKKLLESKPELAEPDKFDLLTGIVLVKISEVLGTVRGEDDNSIKSNSRASNFRKKLYDYTTGVSDVRYLSAKDTTTTTTPEDLAKIGSSFNRKRENLKLNGQIVRETEKTKVEPKVEKPSEIESEAPKFDLEKLSEKVDFELLLKMTKEQFLSASAKMIEERKGVSEDSEVIGAMMLKKFRVIDQDKKVQMLKMIRVQAQNNNIPKGKLEAVLGKMRDFSKIQLTSFELRDLGEFVMKTPNS